jgi:hypothetical protein
MRVHIVQSSSPRREVQRSPLAPLVALKKDARRMSQSADGLNNGYGASLLKSSPRGIVFDVADHEDETTPRPRTADATVC